MLREAYQTGIWVSKWLQTSNKTVWSMGRHTDYVYKFAWILNLNSTLRFVYGFEVNYFDSNFIIFPATFFISNFGNKFPVGNLANTKRSRRISFFSQMK